jgi:chaperone modulatory protein CbpM
MMKLAAVVALFPDLETVELTAWIEQSLVRPDRVAGQADWTFHEIDVARIRLICDLRHNLEMPEEALPTLLSLLDQVYDLRRKLNALNTALEDYPSDVRDTLRPILEKDDFNS